MDMQQSNTNIFKYKFYISKFKSTVYENYSLDVVIEIFVKQKRYESSDYNPKNLSILEL